MFLVGRMGGTESGTLQIKREENSEVDLISG